ncbi:MAG: PilZ domain-containing protein, partial [Planctomycetota bacterium]
IPLSMRVILEIHGLTSPSRFQAIPFDLSRGGIGLFHGRFEYPNTPCSVELRTEDGEGVKVEGVIRRCEMIRGRVHELGVQFKEDVDVNLLLGSASEAPDGESNPERAAFREAIGTVTAALSDKQLDTSAWDAEIAMLREALNQVRAK